MSSLIYPPTPPVGPINRVVTIQEGGTSASSREEAIVKLGAIDASKANMPGGPLTLGPDGKLEVPVSKIRLGAAVAVNGPLTVEAGVPTKYQITNFHATANYELSCSNGSVTRDLDIITYTAGAVTGMGGFTVNGKAYAITVSGRSVMRPTLLSPVDGSSNIGETITCYSNGFSPTSGADSHVSSTWQISENPNFNSIAYQVVDSSANKTSWIVPDLLPNRNYYLRVRHRGTVLGYSDWSSVVAFATKPIFSPSLEQAKLAASDAIAAALFGCSVSMSTDGTYCVVGSSGMYSSKGHAYIFKRDGSSWSQQAVLVATDGVGGDRFGQSVSMNADATVVCIGAPGKQTNTGSAYVFVRSGSTWSQQAKLNSGDRAAQDQLGVSVSVSDNGRTVLVGTPKKNSSAGVAYVFTFNGSAWSQESKLEAADLRSGQHYGCSVAVSGDGNSCIVGAYGVAGLDHMTGCAYVYARVGVVWSQQSKLVPADSLVEDYFGWSVAMSQNGDTVVVGASKVLSGKGAAYVYARKDSAWNMQAKLTGSDTDSSDLFGYCVSISSNGKLVMVSVPGDLNKGAVSGCAYTFTKTSTDWLQDRKLVAADNSIGDKFGWSSAVSGDGKYGAVGSPYNDDRAVDSGNVYLFV